jgi:hypothetical protein
MDDLLRKAVPVLDSHDRRLVREGRIEGVS